MLDDGRTDGWMPFRLIWIGNQSAFETRTKKALIQIFQNPEAYVEILQAAIQKLQREFAISQKSPIDDPNDLHNGERLL